MGITKGGVPRLGVVYACTAFFLLTALTESLPLVWGVVHSPFTGLSRSERWYKAGPGALFHYAVFGAFVSYLRYRRRTPHPQPRPYHCRVEVRIVIYIFATLMFCNLPFWIMSELSRPLTPAGRPTLGNIILHIPFGDVGIPIVVGIGIVAFEYRGAARSRQKSRRAAHQCIACGYDLRATPEQCPECGAV